MKKLRLLVTKYCAKNCEGYYNKEYDLEKLDVVEHYDYDEVLITGGEPLHISILYKTIVLLKYLNFIDINPERKIMVYTANSKQVLSILDYVDGITLTLHHQRDVAEFLHLLFDIEMYNHEALKRKSLRLNIFKDITLPSYADLSLWQVKKDLVWIKDCPIPEGEEFKRLKTLF